MAYGNWLLMEKIKVLHITQSVGGVETYLRLVIQNIDTNKFEIVVASSEAPIEKFCAEQGVRYHNLRMARGFNPFVDIQSIFRLRKIIKQEKPALVHLHSSKAGFVGRIAAKTTNCRSLFTPHGVSYLSFAGFKRMMFFLLELIGKRYTDKILAISHSEASRCMYEIGHKQENIYVIPNSLPIPAAPIHVENKLGTLEGAIKIGTIGRLTPQKNPLLFVDIANAVIKKFPNVHFHFLGAGFHDHLGKEVDKKIKAYGIEKNFHLINKGDHIIALNFLRQIDVFLLPSVFEGLPYALLEAMLEGVPCVVSKCDGNSDVINNNENGFSCLTSEEYASVIEQLIMHKEKAQLIGTKGKEFVIEKHNIITNIKKLENIYATMWSQ